MKKKLLIALGMVLCAALLVVGSIAGTFAYLTSKTDKVTNTFTVGNVKITLDEAKVDQYGELDGNSRVMENTYKLLPAHTYVKDPTVYVDDESEDCWVFVKIDNGIAAIEVEQANTEHETINEQMTANGWVCVDTTNNVWGYATKALSAGDEITPFEEFTVAATADVSAYSGKTIVVTAYAIQADGFGTAQAAWTAAPANWN